MHDPHNPQFDQDPTTDTAPRTTAAGLEAWLAGTYADPPAPRATASLPVAAPAPDPMPSAPDPTLEVELDAEVEAEVGPVNAAEALVLGTFTNARKLVSADGAELVVDLGLKTYYFESNSLKPLTALLQQRAEHWVPVYTEALNATRAAYSAQPLERLRWYAGLIATPGILTRRLPRDQRYKLRHWPETEREFPRHFRIARTMLKDPATIEEIARASGATHSEVVDYINACHAADRLDASTGPEVGAPAPATDPPSRKARLMSRFDPRRLAR